MRINQTQRATARQATRKGASVQGGSRGFSLPRSGEARRSADVRGPAAVSNLDAIVALQAIDNVSERRRRAVRQGSETLDVLDELKIALLSGTVPAAKLERLRALVERFEGHDDEPELRELLRQIDLRARVELAKLGKSVP